MPTKKKFSLVLDVMWEMLQYSNYSGKAETSLTKVISVSGLKFHLSKGIEILVAMDYVKRENVHTFRRAVISRINP